METGENNFLHVVGKKLLWEDSFAVIPKNFDEDIALQCLLIFQVGETSISFALVNKNKASHIGLGQFNFDLSKNQLENLDLFFADNIWLKFQYSNVILIERNRIHTLIPEAFYDSTIHLEYLKNNSFMVEGGINHKFNIKSEEAINLSLLNSEVFYKINSWFSEINTFHHHDVLLEMAAAWQRLNRNDEVVLNLNKDFFDLVIFKNQKLKFCNSYYFEEPEDVLYYTLLVLESHDIIPAEVPLKLIGQMANHKDYLKLLTLYIPMARPFEDLNFIEKSSDLKSVPNYLFATLQNGFLCV